MDSNTNTIAALARVRALCRSGSARAIRQAADVSLGEMASAVGVTPSAVQRWEHGDRAPRGEAAIRYLDVLDRLLRPGDAA